MNEPILLAKSTPDEGYNENVLLISHLKYTYWAAKAILEFTGEATLKALGIEPEQLSRFRRILLLAAAAHDLGKANSLFQSAVRNFDTKQSIRHEWLLYILLRQSPLGKWFRKAFENDTDFTYFIWAITGHHRKGRGKETTEYTGMELYHASPEFQSILQWIADEFDLEPADTFITGIQNITEFTWEELTSLLRKPGSSICRFLRKTETDDEDFIDDEFDKAGGTDQSFMAVIRSFLMAADVTASALADPDFPAKTYPLNEQAIRNWVKENLDSVIPHRSDYENIVNLRIEEIKKKAGQNSQNSRLCQEREEFQNEVATATSRVALVTAGCGSGKTLAAFRWALNKCPAEGKRLFFCYPTTGTATEGFLGYLLDDKNHSFGDLIHSRVAVDFLLNKRMRNVIKGEESETGTVVKTLSLWGTGIVCCTVDTVLGFLVNSYSGHLAWPAFARSIFVFDEIHSYDDRLFGYLIQFLRIMRGTPILLMTASLPEHRIQQIKDVIENQQGEKLQVIRGPSSWEQVKRYQCFIPRDDAENEVIDKAIKEYEIGKKVLWVCNTVNRAVRYAKELKRKAPDCSVKVYHSRFKYRDRVERHKETIEAFNNEKPVICISTQVAEMSLDISADFLIADIAPIPSLIQRLGRLNRRATTDGPKPFCVLFPDKNGEPYLLPYGDEADWWNESKEWLNKLGNQPLSQSDLTSAWEKIAGSFRAQQFEIATSNWSQGLEMDQSNLRKLSSTCDVILKEDWEQVKHGGKIAYLQSTIPMPFPAHKNLQSVKSKYGCVIIVERDRHIDYDPIYGGKWNNEDNSKTTPDGIKEPMIF